MRALLQVGIIVVNGHESSGEYYSKRDSSKGSKPVTADADGTEWRVGEPIGRPGAYGSF